MSQKIRGLDENLESIRTRIIWIDIAKSLGIFAIVLGHSVTGNVNIILYSFNSIVFFMLSGMTFCRLSENDGKFCFNNKSLKEFSSSLFRKIMVPYLCWGLVSIVIYALVGKLIVLKLGLSQSNFSIVKNIVGLLYGNSASGYFEWNGPMWFLPALAITELIWFLILKIIYKIRDFRIGKIIYAGTMLCSLLWMILEWTFDWDLVWPMELETALGMIFFFGIGILIRSVDWDDSFIEKRSSVHKILPSILGVVLTVCLALYNGPTATRIDKFGNLYIYILTAIIASFTIILVSKQIGKNRIMEYIGKRTLAILVMHKFPIMFVKTLFPSVTNMIAEGNIWMPFVLSMITILLCMIAEKIVMIVLPECLGGVRKANNIER